MKEFVEQRITRAMRGLLAGRVNEILGEADLYIPPVEFGEYAGSTAIVPAICLSTSERTEKERIIRLDAYCLTIAFALPETAEGELFCYACAAAVELAVMENPTLDGIADRTVITGKRYKPPKVPYCGEGWEVIITMRVTVEGTTNAG
jgi:hypothetical protein